MCTAQKFFSLTVAVTEVVNPAGEVVFTLYKGGLSQCTTTVLPTATLATVTVDAIDGATNCITLQTPVRINPNEKIAILVTPSDANVQFYAEALLC